MTTTWHIAHLSPAPGFSTADLASIAQDAITRIEHLTGGTMPSDIQAALHMVTKRAAALTASATSVTYIGFSTPAQPTLAQQGHP